MCDVEAVEVHDLGPGGDEVSDEFVAGIGTGVDFGDGAQLGVGAEDEVDVGGCPLQFSGFAVTAFVEVIAHGGLLPFRIHVEEVDEEVIGECAAVFGEDTEVGVTDGGSEDAQAADEHGHFGGGECEELGAVDEAFGCRPGGFRIDVVTEPVFFGFEDREGFDVGHVLGGIGTSRGEGHIDFVSGFTGGVLHGGVTAEDDEVGEGDAFFTALGVIEFRLDLLIGGESFGELSWFIDGPVFLGCESDTGAVGAAAFITAAEGGGGGPGGGDELLVGDAGLEDGGLEFLGVFVGDQRVIDGRDGILPELGGGNVGTEESADGAHVTVGEFVPGFGEGFLELVGVFVEAFGDGVVGGVFAQGDIGGEHDGGVAFGGVMGIGHHVIAFAVFGCPLPGACGAFGEFPVVFVEVFEVAMGPFGRGGGPGAFEAAGDGVFGVSFAVGIDPAEALYFEGCAFGFGADVPLG